jgi:hypothetical protein
MTFTTSLAVDLVVRGYFDYELIFVRTFSQEPLQRPR